MVKLSLLYSKDVFIAIMHLTIKSILSDRQESMENVHNQKCDEFNYGKNDNAMNLVYDEEQPVLHQGRYAV